MAEAQIAGVPLYYELIEGSPERPYLVFLHEGLGCVEMWKDFPRRLCAATGCPGLVYDRRGYGRSPRLAGPRTIHYVHEYALVELPAVLDALIPGREYFLIGHSDGGSIALIHAAARPARLVGLVTEASHVFVDEETLAGIRAATASFLAGGMRGLYRYHGDKTDEMFWAWSDTWQSPWFLSWSLEYLLPAVAAPVLVLQGTEDRYGTQAQVETIATRVANGKAVLLEGAGHSPHLDQSDAVLRLVAGFVAGIEGRRTAASAGAA